MTELKKYSRKHINHFGISGIWEGEPEYWCFFCEDPIVSGENFCAFEGSFSGESLRDIVTKYVHRRCAKAHYGHIVIGCCGNKEALNK